MDLVIYGISIAVDYLPDILIRCAAFLWPFLISINCVGGIDDRHLKGKLAYSVVVATYYGFVLLFKSFITIVLKGKASLNAYVLLCVPK